MVKEQKNKTNNEIVIDAKDKVLGRLASDIAFRLQGKHEPTWQPNKNSGVKIRITNAISLRVTGKKATKKLYWRHSGYPGGIYNKKYEEIFAADPSEVIKRAVFNMLPKNKLRKERMKNLIIEK